MEIQNSDNLIVLEVVCTFSMLKKTRELLRAQVGCDCRTKKP